MLAPKENHWIKLRGAWRRPQPLFAEQPDMHIDAHHRQYSYTEGQRLVARVKQQRFLSKIVHGSTPSIVRATGCEGTL